MLFHRGGDVPTPFSEQSVNLIVISDNSANFLPR